MKEQQLFRRELIKIAVPVTLQCLLQSSFSVVDQIMTGQLGSANIAGIGLGGKFCSLFSVVISAVAAAAGIMIAQYIGKGDQREAGRSFSMNLLTAAAIAAVFTGLCSLFPSKIMGLYTQDYGTRAAASGYLQIVALSFFPLAISALLSTLLRCMGAAVIPLYAGIAAALLNTGLNYVLIFGKMGFPSMGIRGAAAATVIAQMAGCFLTLALFFRTCRRTPFQFTLALSFGKMERKQYAGILIPILACEFLWSLGENIYASVYGHMGTIPCAAMTLTAPVQGLTIGALSGLSQAAGIMTGKSLGASDYDKAYRDSKRFMLYGLAGSVLLSAALMAFSSFYVDIYQVEEEVKLQTIQILLAFAVIAPVKVLNMILGGGIIRSGGKTSYIMVIDFIGTWLFGVPLSLLSAFALDLPIAYVYFVLSLEEGVRLVMTLFLFKRKSWMTSLKQQPIQLP